MDIEDHSSVSLLEYEDHHVSNALKKLNRKVIPVLVGFALLCHLNRATLSYAANQFCEAVGLTYIEYGLGVSLFYVTYAIFQIPSNLVLMKVGAPLWFAVLILGWGLASFLMLFARNAELYYVFRLLLGVFEAGAFPGLYFYMIGLFPSGFEYAMSCINCASFLVMPFTAFLAAGLLGLDGYFNLDGWQWLFLVESLLPIVYSVLIFTLIPKDLSSAKFLTDVEKEHLQDLNLKKEAAKEASGKPAPKIALLKIIKIRDFWFLTIATFFQITTADIVQSYMVLMIASIMDTSSQENTIINTNSDSQETCSSNSISIIPTLLASIPYFIIAITTYTIGSKFQNIQHRPYFMSSLYIISAVALLALAFFQHRIAMALIFLTIGFSAMVSGGVLVFSILASILDKDTYAFGFALFLSISVAGGIAGPSAAGIIIDNFGFQGQFICSGLSMTFAAVLYTFISENNDHYKGKDIRPFT